ncbi:MAG TPA: hypothetical protein VHV74_19865 [Pseudonocardiaceae bacterium]|nr:hypothetical protein [Pseudonocardiaceae bacterium]
MDSYVEEAQVQDYENTRAQFEAFVDHSTAAAPSTGTIYWQANKAPRRATRRCTPSTRRTTAR